MSWEIIASLVLGNLRLQVELLGGEQPVALIGPNGAGKTTLLRTLAGVHRPAAGRITIGGQVVFDSKGTRNLPPEKRRVGYVPQGSGLFPHLRVVDNVAFGLNSTSIFPSRAKTHGAALEILGELGCAHLSERWPETLSGGERQRVALARTLILEPRLLLLDEPLGALDASARRSLREYLASYLQRSGTPTVFVTHDRRDVVALGAHVVVLDGGRVIQSGSIEEVLSEPANEFVTEFFHL